MDNIIPNMSEEVINKQFQVINDLVINGNLNTWIDTELETMKNSNPVLYKFILNRSQNFAASAIIAHDIRSISLSFALEIIIFIKILETTIGDSGKLEEFTNYMRGLLKDAKIEGLDEFNNKKV